MLFGCGTWFNTLKEKHRLRVILFIPCIVNDCQIIAVRTDAQCCSYVLHSSLAATCFGVTAIIRNLIPVLLKLIAIK
jgi:hypothetical protein